MTFIIWLLLIVAIAAAILAAVVLFGRKNKSDTAFGRRVAFALLVVIVGVAGSSAIYLANLTRS
jgi:hypothetical protein